MEMFRIFVVEDDAVIAEQIKKNLSRWGYEVECARDFRNVMAEFAQRNPHLVLLDVGLPFYNGHYWCGQIRQVSQVPILFVSSAGDNMNIVMAVNMGGDDFLVKPFDSEVLAAKVQALLRRAYSFRGQADVQEYKGILLNLAEAALVVNGQKQELTKNEFRILQVLMERPEQTVSRETLMKKLWDDDCFVDDNTLTVNVTRLKRKLEGLGAGGVIRTRKGLGYCLEKEDAGK